jgi:hypothetical protein
MKTPIIIDDIEVKAIVDTGAATCAITSNLLEETPYKINQSSNTRCIMANGLRIASLGKAEIEIEIGDIITPIIVEVIESDDWTLIIGNDFLKEWNSNIDFDSQILTLQDNEITLKLPVTYTRQKKVTFEIPQESDEEGEYEVEEIKETFNIYDLEEEEVSSDDEAK